MHSRALLASGRSLHFMRLNKERDALVTARAKKHHQDQLTQYHTLPGLSQITSHHLFQCSPSRSLHDAIAGQWDHTFSLAQQVCVSKNLSSLKKPTLNSISATADIALVSLH